MAVLLARKDAKIAHLMYTLYKDSSKHIERPGMVDDLNVENARLNR